MVDQVTSEADESAVCPPLVERACTAGEFRRALGRFATGVVIVTARLNGADHAMTVNAFASVSLSPPIVLMCVRREARFHPAIVRSGKWAVSVLAAEAQHVAEWLSTNGRPLAGQLDGVPHHRSELTGAAIIDGALSVIECRTRAVFPGGDHDVILGDVLGLHAAGHRAALVYYGGTYGRLDG